MSLFLNFHKALRRPETSFGELGANLDAAVAASSAAPPRSPADEALLNEAKLTCTQGMLLCLDRPHRLAYILGEILELPGDEAAAILEIQPAAFRKRLSRARDEMEAFLAGRCEKLLPVALAAGIVDANRLRLRALPVRAADKLLIGIEQARTAAEVFRSLPTYAAPADFGALIRTTLSQDG